MAALRDASRSSVRGAYEALAPAYDLFTTGFAHERWLARLEALAISHGLGGRRVLDVACGTGKSFLPLLARGYEVTGCDISPAMLERAAAKAPGVRLLTADMRELPALGEFDLVTCLDDALNYLTERQELLGALRGIRRCLAPDGIGIWDVNTTAMYRDAFARTWVVEDEDAVVLWRGAVTEPFAAGGRARADIDVFARDGSAWRRATSRHEQRHWPVPVLMGAAREAGLAVVDVHGQHRGATLEPDVDEDRHTKVVFLVRRDQPRSEGRCTAC